MKHPVLTESEKKAIEWQLMDRNYQDYLDGKAKADFRNRSVKSYSGGRLGYHEDSAPESRNPSLHKSY